ncbi:unnamed protein product [Lepidochelys olivacea]
MDQNHCARCWTNTGQKDGPGLEEFHNLSHLIFLLSWQLFAVLFDGKHIYLGSFSHPVIHMLENGTRHLHKEEPSSTRENLSFCTSCCYKKEIYIFCLGEVEGGTLG